MAFFTFHVSFFKFLYLEEKKKNSVARDEPRARKIQKVSLLRGRRECYRMIRIMLSNES